MLNQLKLMFMSKVVVEILLFQESLKEETKDPVFLNLIYIG